MSKLYTVMEFSRDHLASFIHLSRRDIQLDLVTVVGDGVIQMMTSKLS